MQAWQELLKTALLGTERQAAAPLVDEALKPYLEQLYPGGQVPADSREAAYLSAAALIGTYYRAGQQAEPFPGEVPAPSVADELPVVNDTAMAHLRLMISDKELAPLLPEWLRTIQSNRLRLPPLLLPQMLDMAARQKSLRPLILEVIGRRGQWLARHQDQWQRLMDEAPVDTDDEMDNDVWETGTLAQRVAYLTRQRNTDHEQARALLQDTWKQDAAKERAALLETLETGLQVSDEAFLERCLTDKSKEVRQRAAGLLARLPDSAFAGRIKERLQTWLSYSGKSGLMGALSKKGQLTVNLPQQWDKSWQQDGISEKAPGGKGQKAWWLEQTLALVPPAYWCEQWDLSAAQVLALVHKHEWEAPLRAGLQQAMLRHEDAQFAEAWLRTVSADDTDMWNLLQAEQSESVLAELIGQARGGDAMINVLHLLPQLRHPWSEVFSKSVVDAWQKALSNKKQRHYMHHVFKSTALGLHTGAIEYFAQKLQTHLDFESPNYKQVQDAMDILRFRQDMLSAIIS